MDTTLEIVLSVLVGVGLSAACGFRVFVPLLVISIASKTAHLSLAPGFDWMGSWPALVAFSLATALEITAYYVPWLDNLMDSIATPAAIVAGVIATAACIGDMSPFLKWTLAVIAGGDRGDRRKNRQGRHHGRTDVLGELGRRHGRERRCGRDVGPGDSCADRRDRRHRGNRRPARLAHYPPPRGSIGPGAVTQQPSCRVGAVHPPFHVRRRALVGAEHLSIGYQAAEGQLFPAFFFSTSTSIMASHVLASRR
jgi:hypothetical protein